jgi:hypothetical protein
MSARVDSPALVWAGRNCSAGALVLQPRFGAPSLVRLLPWFARSLTNLCLYLYLFDLMNECTLGRGTTSIAFFFSLYFFQSTKRLTNHWGTFSLPPRSHATPLRLRPPRSHATPLRLRRRAINEGRNAPPARWELPDSGRRLGSSPPAEHKERRHLFLLFTSPHRTHPGSDRFHSILPSLPRPATVTGESSSPATRFLSFRTRAAPRQFAIHICPRTDGRTTNN